MNPAPSNIVERQVSGYWLDRERPTPGQPSYEFTGAVLPRLDETDFVDFLCLDLVLVDVGTQFVWLPLSEAGRYTYPHSLGLLYGESWRLVVYDRGGGLVHEYDATYAELLPQEQIAGHYGAVVALRTRQDYPAVQLRLRRRAAL